jgi:hypothetical protein
MMKKCKHCDSENIRVGVAVISSGAIVYPWYCSDCNFVYPVYVKKEIANELERTTGELVRVKTRTQEHYEKQNIVIECQVCGTNGAELHHWAPRYLFEDAENWPKSYLCVPCHKRWHNVVTPDMSTRK